MTSLALEYAGQRVDLLALMRHITQHEVAAHYSPWFFTYYADLTGERYLRKYVHFLRGFLDFCPGGIQGRVGCGGTRRASNLHGSKVVRCLVQRSLHVQGAELLQLVLNKITLQYIW